MGMVFALAALLLSAEEPLVYFDLQKCIAGLPDDSVLRYDTVKLVASLQGIVNRDRPRLLLKFLDATRQGQPINLDDYWLEIEQRSLLKDRVIQREDQLDRLFQLFPEALTGAVIWDPAVLATANAAATVCGVEGWLPVRADSALYTQVVENGPKLPVKLSLVGKFDGKESGSRKCDAYLWAKREYLDKGLCNPGLMAYYIDAYSQKPGKEGFHYTDLCNATLVNQDYYIARKAFFFDLGVWPDETPVDDPEQPMGTDRKTLCELLKAQYAQNKGQRFTTVGGFVPWNLKYTNHGAAGGRHEPVPSEWEYAALLSAHNAIMDADALGLSCLTNASAYMYHRLRGRYAQNPRPSRQVLEPKTYVLIYMGDYDSAAWLSRMIPDVWDDPVRGELPIAWAFNPNLSDRVPYVFNHVYETRSPNDWFIAGDSGAGYLNPNLLTGGRLGSGIPDALELWVAHNMAYYRRFDYSITGFVINGFHGKMPYAIQEAYGRFSPDGVGMQLNFDRPLVHEVPFLRHASDIYPDLGDLGKTAQQMASFARPDKPQFLIFRWILQKPGTVKAVRDLLVQQYPDQQWEFCDPYTFFDLYRKHLK
ncbi:MAG TPA: GxGYxYP family putative glycoside hydrolase [Candidatus Hydrogenedentes bacterium]|nr:GxGYxYP family putative glycoside hydrolase [Candidatus Hydrogenedentota bacterium]